MSVSHGKDTRVYVNGFDLSAYFNDASHEGTCDVAEVATFADSAKEILAGLKSGKLSLAGVYDGAAAAVDEFLESVLGAAAESIWTYLPQGDAIGNVAYGVKGVETAYSVKGSITDAVRVNAEVNSNVGEERLTVHHALGSEVASGSSAAQDGGAASSNGGVGYLHVPDITGITNLAVVIEDSADGSTGWATILTFTGITADNGKERVAITGTVRRHTRATWTFTGAGSAQFFVGFGRK